MVPKWAAFFRQQKYDNFLNLVRQYFEKQQMEIKDYFYEGYFYVTLSDSNRVRFGLVNLAKHCSTKSQSKWKTIIKQHFDHYLNTIKIQEEFNRKAQNFKFAKKYLGVKVYPTSRFQQEHHSRFMFKEFTDDLVAALVFVQKQQISIINAEEFPNWNKDIDELFEIGHANIKKQYPIKFEKITLKNELQIFAANTDHFFATNVIFDLDQRTELVGRLGTIVSIPNRNITLLYPIQETTPASNAVLAYKEFTLTGRTLAAEQPGRISDQAYWFHNGEFTPLSYMVVTKDTKPLVILTPPDSFQDMLNKLDPSEKDDIEN